MSRSSNKTGISNSVPILPVPILLAVALACSSSRDSKPAEKTPAPPATDPSWPTRETLRSTTSPGLALHNLDQRIADLERRIARTPPQPRLAAELVPLVLTRAQFLGRIDDYDRALAAAESYVRAAPAQHEPYTVRARALARVHRFDEALADIEAAHRRGLRPDTTRELRASIYQATGDMDQALALRTELARQGPSLGTLGSLAALHAELDQRDAAEARFGDALRAYRDVSPFDVAWLLMQWGLLYERQGELARARTLYELAHERLPAYADAASHLAATLAAQGELAQAAAILRPLAETEPTPDILGQLAELEGKLGQTDMARALADRATRDFDAWLERYPTAFADHAARYFLGPGQNPARALTLARDNAARRPTASALTLAIETALAAGAAADGCAAAEIAVRLPHATRRLLFQAWRAFEACGNQDRARELAARLGIDETAAP